MKRENLAYLLGGVTLGLSAPHAIAQGRRLWDRLTETDEQRQARKRRELLEAQLAVMQGNATRRQQKLVDENTAKLQEQQAASDASTLVGIFEQEGGVGDILEDAIGIIAAG